LVQRNSASYSAPGTEPGRRRHRRRPTARIYSAPARLKDNATQNRHPGLVPGSAAPRVMAKTLEPLPLLRGGCRDKPGMTMESVKAR